MARSYRVAARIVVPLCVGGIALSVILPGFAQQGKLKSAAPAAPPSQTAPAPGPLNDPMLQKRVSLNLKDATINQTVEALSKVANVSLIVERPSSLAVKPVTVAINDAKLRDVMDMLGQLYGYRWRRKNDVFLLTFIPQKEDMDKFGEEAMKTIYNEVLTPEQRAKVDADGYISGKDLTPGQQGIIAGYLQDMMQMAMSSNMSIGKVVIDRANHTFSINMGDGKDSKP
jgi:hypothetical protein